MTRRLEFWELTACGAAAGGTGVWGLAAAARVGWLRAFLDLFPHSSWDALTWVLIPILLLSGGCRRRCWACSSGRCPKR